MVLPLCGYQIFYLLPWKLGFLAQKRPNSSQKMHLFSTYRSCWLFCCPVVVCRLYLARRLFALCICCKLANVANYLIFGVIFFALKNMVMDFLDKFQVCQWPDQKSTWGHLTVVCITHCLLWLYDWHYIILKPWPHVCMMKFKNPIPNYEMKKTSRIPNEVIQGGKVREKQRPLK